MFSFLLFRPGNAPEHNDAAERNLPGAWWILVELLSEMKLLTFMLLVVRMDGIENSAGAGAVDDDDDDDDDDNDD